jgi:hypothetical protein
MDDVLMSKRASEIQPVARHNLLYPKGCAQSRVIIYLTRVMKDTVNRVALVTGANRGIGPETESSLKVRATISLSFSEHQ